MNFTQEERDILLLALDLYERSLKEVTDGMRSIRDFDGSDRIDARRQEIVDLAARVRRIGTLDLDKLYGWTS
jgi:hypothetical protein